MKNDSKLDNYLAKQQLKLKRSEQAKRDNKFFPVIAAGALALAILSQLVYLNIGSMSQSGPSAPNSALSEDRLWQGSMNLNESPVEFELFGDLAPQAVANFVSLTNEGFFEDVNCHRLVTEGIFVLQCGDPDGNGSGGPGYNWGPIENAPADDLYTEGTIAMARVGGDDYSMGSQFFIVYEDSTIPSDGVGGYTIFGKVTSGLESVKAIAEAGTSSGSSDGPPAEPVVMTSVSVE
jgi:peptidyl-prolyl cis-trans isomerase B (cyclophilin B)